ncbi:hypothetical protein HK414_25335 [Ramlibacter terrae]|uniref:Uncharacterized protein n=1 Tax=Ramlibacter terrae TaxID=2732511 RepID=A0ABX6NZI5_9BURK|nr:hypothetical protein HK414_25335 [Ramlibacter terrae]
MTDPRNIAHDKKVAQEKKHRHEEVPHGAHAVQPGKKPHLEPAPVAEVQEPAATPGESVPDKA